MNGPFVVAQANTGTSSAAPVQVLKLIKPQAGHTDILHASFTGTVKIDFTVIANEKITLFHDSKNQSLHVIFADGSQIIIEPFFDSRGTVLANLLFEMTPNQFYSGEEFAQNLPITEDPSVVPAAGDINVLGSGDFHDPSVDPLGLSNPLDLLPPEELPNIKFTETEAPTIISGQITGAPSAEDSFPTADGSELFIDDEGQQDPHSPGIAGSTLGTDDVAGEATGFPPPQEFLNFSFGPAGPGNIVFHVASFHVTDEAGNPVTLQARVFDPTANGGTGAWLSVGVDVTASPDGHTVTGTWQDTNGGTHDAFVLQITDVNTGEYSFQANVAFVHPFNDPSLVNQTGSEYEDNLTFAINFTVSDAIGNTATANLHIGIDDDSPDGIAQSVPGSFDGQFYPADPIDDEDQSGGIQGGNGDDGLGTQTSGVLNIQYGADGPSTFDGESGVNPLEISATNITILNDLAQDNGPLYAISVDSVTKIGTPELVTYQWDSDSAGGGTLYGFSASHPDTSNPVFTLTIDAAGNYTFTAFAPLSHPFNADGAIIPGPSGFEDNLDLVFNYIATDGDGDQTTGTITINVDDDIPTITGSVDQAPTIGVSIDETNGVNTAADPNPADDVDPASAPTALADAITAAGVTMIDLAESQGATAQDLFIVNFGADGENPVNGLSLQLTTAGGAGFTGEDTGLTTTVGGFAIHLFTDPSDPNIVWGVANGDLSSGERVFALYLDGTGHLWVAQFEAIAHDLDGSTPAAYDDIASLAQGLLHVSAIATDGDSDSVAATSSASLSVNFQDDGIGVDVSLASAEEGSGSAQLAGLVLDESIGTDPADPNAANDDNPPVTDPSYITAANSSLAIGITSTPGNADPGTSVSDLFQVTKFIGTDGLAGEQKIYSLTLTNDSGDPVLAGSGDGVLTNLHVTETGGSPVDGFSADNRAIYLFKVSDTEIVGLIGQATIGSGDDFVALRILLDVSNPSDPILKVEQYLPLEHPINPNNFDESIFLNFAEIELGGASLSVTLTDTVTDGDGDTATDSQSVTLASVADSDTVPGLISFQDDGPSAAAITASANGVVHDETEGLQTIGDPNASNDVASGALPPAIKALFDAIGVDRGSDPDVTQDDHAIGFAASLGALANTSGGAFGTDGPHTGLSEVFSLSVVDGTFSGLKTTEGVNIYLYNGSGPTEGLILGRLGNDSDAIADDPNANGTVAFALTVDPNTGFGYIAQYLSLQHPDQANAGNGFNSYDEQISLVPDSVQLAATLVDGDGDTVASLGTNVGQLFGFQDDGPTVNVGLAEFPEGQAPSLTMDESIGLDPLDPNATVDDNGLVTAASYILAPDATKAIGILSVSDVNASLTDLFTVSANGGADGLKSQSAEVFTFTLKDANGQVVTDPTVGVATQVVATDVVGSPLEGLSDAARTIWFYRVSDTEIIGVVGRNADGSDNLSVPDYVALHIFISGTDLTVEQYLALENPIGGPSYDEPLAVLMADPDSSLGVTASVTVTDGDNDTKTDSETFLISTSQSSALHIEDDGISAGNTSPTIVLDDEGQPLGQLSPDAPEDVDVPEAAKVATGTLPITLGIDGLTSISVATTVSTTDSAGLPGSVSIIYVDPSDKNKGTPEAVSFSWVPDGSGGGDLIGTSAHYTGIGLVPAAIVLHVNADGTYTLTLNAPLDHPYIDSDFNNTGGPEIGYEDNLILNFTYTATDGDTDTAPAVLSVNVDDDKPVSFTPEDALLSNAPGTQNFLLHVFGHTGADGLGTVVFTGIANGDAATGIPQGSGDPLTSGGQPIYLYFGSNGTDHTVLIGSTITPLEFNNGSGINPSTEAIFQISLTPDAAFAPGDIYTVQVFAPVDNGSGIIFNDFSEIGSPGHVDFLVSDLPGTQDLIVQGTVSTDHVNTAAFNSSVDIGVNNQWIDEAEGVILDFVDLNNVASNPPGINGHNTVNGGSFTIAHVQGGGTGDVFVRAFTVDDDNNYEPRVSDPQDDPVAITGITVNGVAVAGTAFDPGDGFGSGFVLQNLNEGDVVVVTTATGFQRLQISNANDLGGPNVFDGDPFSVTDLGVQTVTAGSPVVLSYDVLMTDGDGDGVTGTMQIGLEPAGNPLVQTSAFSGIVEEEQLGNLASPLYLSSFTGNEDQTATPDNDLDTANSGPNALITREFVAGSYGVTGGTGPYTFHFDTSFEGAQAQFANAPLGVTSHGEPVLLHFNGNTLFGYTNVGGAGYTEGVDHVVFTYEITNSSTGAATFTLYDNLDHHTVAAADNVEGTRALNLNGIVQVTDSSPSAQTISLNGSVGIIDDIPVATNNTASVNEGGNSITDLLLMIDTSASMTENPGVPGFATRLDLEKAALINLLNSDNVDEVFIVNFNTSATNSGGWLSRADAITFINGLTASGLTNYDAALASAETAFTFAHTPADQTLSYFLSDGVPTWPLGSIGINASEQATWESFLTTNGIAESFAVGLGADANLNALQPVAFPNSDPNNPILLTDESLIVPTLPGLLPGTVTGNVLIDDSGSGVDGFGADGRGAGGGIVSITVDGHIYAYDSVTNTISKDGLAFAAGGTLDINTALTGELIFHFVDSVGFAAGDWQYKSPANVNANTVETFHYVIADGDGDQAGADLAVTIYATNQPPVAGDDSVITNISGSGAAIGIPDLALLLNDTDPNGPTLSISSVGSAASGSVAHLGLVTTFTDNNTNGGSFDYTLQDLGSPNLTDTGHVTIDRAQAGASELDGTSVSDILIGRAAQADTLVGGTGSDVLYGNTGADHFRYNAPSEGLDHILDFHTAEGDVIDILASAFGGGLTAGTDATGMFGSSVNNDFGSVNERFHFNTLTHTLLYDSNGSAGGGTQVALAVLENNGSVDAAHIHMV